MIVGCLHTAQSNVAVLERAAMAIAHPGLRLRHMVRPELLSDAELAGGVTEEIAARTRAALAELADGSDVVVLNCSTLGEVADAIAPLSVPVLRVDAALARRAVSRGGRVMVLCAVATSIAASRNLFETAAHGTSASIDVRLVDGAWALFRAGRNDDYLGVVAAAADQAMADGASVVALAQASMAAADVLCKEPPLTSPRIGLEAAIGLASAPR